MSSLLGNCYDYCCGRQVPEQVPDVPHTKPCDIVLIPPYHSVGIESFLDTQRWTVGYDSEVFDRNTPLRGEDVSALIINGGTENFIAEQLRQAELPKLEFMELCLSNTVFASFDEFEQAIQTLFSAHSLHLKAISVKSGLHAMLTGENLECKVHDMLGESIRSLKNLEQLSYVATTIPNALLESIFRLPRLVYLYLNCVEVPKHVRISAPGLEYLDIQASRMDASSQVCRLDCVNSPGLRKVRVCISRAVVHVILSQNGKQLRWLDVRHGTAIDGDLTNVTVLKLSRCDAKLVSDMSTSKRLPNLLEFAVEHADNIAVDATKTLQVVILVNVKKVKLQTTALNSLALLVLEKVDLTEPSKGIHAQRVWLGETIPIDLMLVGTTHFGACSWGMGGNISTVLKPVRNTIVVLAIAPVINLPILPNLEILCVPTRLEAISSEPRTGRQLQEIAISGEAIQSGEALADVYDRVCETVRVFEGNGERSFYDILMNTKAFFKSRLGIVTNLSKEL